MLTACDRGEIKPNLSQVDPKLLHELQQRKERFEELRQRGPEFDLKFDSPERLLRSFFFCATKDDQKCAARHILSEKEYTESYWPFAPAERNEVVNWGPDAVWEMTQRENAMGYEDIRKRLQGRTLGAMRIDWKQDKSETMGPFVVHPIRHIYVQTELGEEEIEEVRFILEYEGKYKIGTLSP